MDKDYSIIVCKGCGESKKRIRSGLYPNGKDVRWLDESGGEFNGLRCPKCHKGKVRQTKRLNDAIKKAIRTDE